MEKDSRKKRRRDKAHTDCELKSGPEMSEESASPVSSPSPKGKRVATKAKNKMCALERPESPVCEELILDGFLISSFHCEDDMKESAKKINREREEREQELELKTCTPKVFKKKSASATITSSSTPCKDDCVDSPNTSRCIKEESNSSRSSTPSVVKEKHSKPSKYVKKKDREKKESEEKKENKENEMALRERTSPKASQIGTVDVRSIKKEQIDDTRPLKLPHTHHPRDHFTNVTAASERAYQFDSESGTEEDKASDASSTFTAAHFNRESNLSTGSSASSTLAGPLHPPPPLRKELPRTHNVTRPRANSPKELYKPSHWERRSANHNSSQSRHISPSHHSKPSLPISHQKTPSPYAHHSHHSDKNSAIHSAYPQSSPTMFLAPPPLATPSLPSFPPSQRDLLRHELDRRFLQSNQDRAREQGGHNSAAFLDIHQHQHQHMHQHQHTHQHNYGLSHQGSLPYPLGPASQHMKRYLGPTHLGNTANKMDQEKIEKLMPKFGDSSLYRQISGSASYSGGVSPLLPPPSSASSHLANAGLHGAFTPKNISNGGMPGSMQQAQLIMSMRERDRASVPMGPSPTDSQTRKSGKWCAAHVKIAWEIHHLKLKQQQTKNVEDKLATEPIRPPSHLMGLHRPGQDNTPSGVLGGHARSPFDSPHPSPMLNVSHIGAPPFPRPSPYGVGPLSALNNGVYRDLPLGMHGQGLSASQDWNRLHRTPSSFPAPPSWKCDMERERELALSASRDRREDERRSSLDKDREKLSDREAERERERENRTIRSPRRDNSNERHRDIHRDSRHNEDNGCHLEDRHRSRSRSPMRHMSRSPIRNGVRERSGSASKLDTSAFNHHNGINKMVDPHIKQERKDDIVVLGEKERGYPPHDILPNGLHPSQAILLERSRAAAINPYAGLTDRRPPFWNPMLGETRGLPPHMIEFGINQHNLELRREIERHREELSRQINPLGSLIELERLKEQHEMFLREREIEARRHMERIVIEREMSNDRNKIMPSLRPVDSYLAPMSYLRPSSPPTNHYMAHMNGINGPNSSKGNSPAGSSVGGPPPLIPSTSQTRCHSSTPSSKARSPIDKSKIETVERRETNGNIPQKPKEVETHTL